MNNNERRHEACNEARCGCCQTWNVRLGFACTCKGESKSERLDRIMAASRRVEPEWVRRARESRLPTKEYGLW